MTRTPCRYGSVRAAIAAALLALALPVLGAAPAADADEDQELSEVLVTGTRIQSPNVTAANPITSISGEEMRRLGIVNVADALLTLVPQNISTYSPFLTGDNPGYTGNDTSGGTLDRGSLFIGNTIANLRGMDPAFGSRTLTLIDGRRTVSTSNQADVVDLNIIPSNLLERMDVVTGGASATYGSGAMAGVVNLVLARRLTGVNLDMDYGVNEAGDGGSPHVSLSGGTPLFGGKGHVLLGLEWQDQKAIRDCAAARDWCARSRSMFTNSSGSLSNINSPLAALPGYGDVDGDGRGDYPARFEMSNVRYSQFAPTGTIYTNDASRTSGFRFSDDGTGVEEYAYGFRGGAIPAGGTPTAMNGDGPLLTSGTTLRPSTERKSAFANFEYDFTSRTTAYLQGSYATTDSLNVNPFTQSTTCARFNTTGVAAIPGGSARAGDVIYYGNNGESFTNYPSGTPVTGITRTPITANTNFRAFVGVTALGAPTSAGITARSAPYIIVPGTNGSTDTTPPVYTNFSANVVNPVWQNVRSASGSRYWNLVSITLTANFDDPGQPAVLPQLGRNAYAFLSNLSPEALYQVQNAFNNSTTAGATNSALSALYGVTPCSGFTAMRKVWNPQIQQSTTQKSDTWRTVAGVRGRFGSDWRWEGYYQYGATDSKSKQYNVATNLSFNFAMDAVIDNRPDSSTFGTPICRITRDGVPVLDSTGRPMSDPEGLAALAAGCQALNVFGTTFADSATLPGYDVAYNPAELQRQALAYAFKDSISDGANSLQTLSFNTSGTLWQGWAGPLTAAFGAELTENTVDNKGSRGPYYARADFARAWGDAFGGKTRSIEGFTEWDLPLVTGQDGINQFSVNAGVRYTSYYNKGGAGTTGASATQDTLNWKFQSVFEPFEWMRFRLTRSRDLRAAGYRDLFLNQPGIPDQASGVNPWRERSEDSDENQRERWGFIRVGNADLTTEKSNTLTLGMVLSPGGWAQGMRLSADYYTIHVKDAIYTPFNFESPITACWENSGNIDFLADPDNAVNGLYNPDLPECQEIAFGVNPDGSRDLTDVVSYNSSRPTNNLPYQRRGIDFSWSYNFPLNRALEGLPGSMALTVRGTRALESSGIQQSCGSFVTVDGTTQCVDTFSEVELVGQIRSSVFIPGVAATPKWTGNITSSYLFGDFTGSLSARYIGGANLDNTWTDDPQSPTYRNAAGQVLNGSVDNNRVDPYINFSLNASYNLKVANMKQFQLFGSVNNLFDKSPPFTGGGISGASASFNDTMGRAYRMGVRLKF